MDKAVENILKWLQLRYEQRNRIGNTGYKDKKLQVRRRLYHNFFFILARQELANMRSPNYTMRPQPFAVTRASYDLQSGYPAFTFPTAAQFNQYNQTQYSSQATQQYQITASVPNGPPYQYPPASDNPLQYPTSVAASNTAPSNTPYLYRTSPTSNTPSNTPYQYRTSPTNTPYQYPASMTNTQFYTTSSEPPYTYLLPDSQNPDIDESTDTSVIFAQSDVNLSSENTTPESTNSESTLATDENSINDLETKSHQAPHIHAIDVQCSKDRMTINLEFNEVYNGIIYSKVG